MMVIYFYRNYENGRSLVYVANVLLAVGAEADRRYFGEEVSICFRLTISSPSVRRIQLKLMMPRFSRGFGFGQRFLHVLDDISRF